MVGRATVIAGAPGLVLPPSRATIMVQPARAGLQASVAGSAAVVVGEQQGIAGPAGTDHGFISYGEAATAPAMMLVPDEPAQLTFSAAVLNGILATSPFAGHALWDGSVIRPRKAGDTMVLRLDLSSNAFVSNGSIEIQLDIGGKQGVIQTIPRQLKKPAGVQEPISESFPVYVGTTFLENGGALLLEASVPTTISMVALIIFPLSAAP